MTKAPLTNPEIRATMGIESSIVQPQPPRTENLMRRIQELEHALERERLRSARFASLAERDYLTKLANRRGLTRALMRGLYHLRRYETPMVFVYFDLDGFKAINDNFGHKKGDNILSAVGSALQVGIRASDTAGRLGGDEFGVLFWDAAVHQITQRVSTLELSISELGKALVGQELGVSTGMTELINTDTIRDVVSRADRQMYRVKAIRKRPLCCDSGR
jgi:diguanylate cyclase (GGDEF)-like protein